MAKAIMSVEEAKRIWADVYEITSEKLLHVRPKLKMFEAHHALEKSRLAFLDAWTDGRDEGQMRAAALAPLISFKLKKGVHWA